MKINNWCKKLTLTLAAGGLLAPGAVHAAGLGVNLIQNPGFELVGSTPGVYGAKDVLNWTDGSRAGFAYSYSQGYDFGGPLAGGGTYFFTPNQSGGDGTNVTAAATVMQIIDVSTGPTATAIANGSATFALSGFFTSYLRNGGTDADIGNIELRFVDSSNAGISAVVLSDPNPSAGWKLASTNGAVPVGTAKLYVSLYGTPVVSGPDGYLDNLDLTIRGVPEPSAGVLASLGAAAMGLFRRFRGRRES
jgi:hypothetical protein